MTNTKQKIKTLDMHGVPVETTKKTLFLADVFTLLIFVLTAMIVFGAFFI